MKQFNLNAIMKSEDVVAATKIQEEVIEESLVQENNSQDVKNENVSEKDSSVRKVPLPLPKIPRDKIREIKKSDTSNYLTHRNRAGEPKISHFRASSNSKVQSSLDRARFRQMSQGSEDTKRSYTNQYIPESIRSRIGNSRDRGS